MTNRVCSHSHWPALAVVLLIATYLRLGHSSIVEYKFDEAILSQLALDFAHGRTFPLLGMGSSVGIPNAPFNVYILAIPYFFTTNPIIVTQYIGLLNVAAIGFTYGFIRRYTNTMFALIAVLMFAANPWAVFFSRKLWAQDMLLLFVVLSIFSGVLGFVEGKRWAQLLHIPLLVITGQIHYGAFVIIPASIYLVWYGRRRLSRVFVISCIVALIIVLPYGIGVFRAGFANIDTFRESLSSGEESSTLLTLSDDAIYGAYLLTTGIEIHSLAGPQEYKNYLASVPGAYPLWVVFIIGLSMSTLWLIFRSIFKRDDRTIIDITLLLWLLFPVVAFSVTWTPFYIHYLIPMIPAAFVILGFCLQDLWISFTNHRLRNILFSGGGLVVILALLLQITLWISLLKFVDQRATPDGFGTPLHYLMDVQTAITESETQQVIGRFERERDETVWQALLYDIPIVRFEADGISVYPTDDYIYLTDSCGSDVHFNLRPGEGCYSLKYDREMEINPNPIQPPVSFANGVHLVGYIWDGKCLSIQWKITAETQEDYMFAVKFFNDANKQVAQADGLSWRGVYWRAGDIVIREFCLPASDADITSVHLGMYTYDSTTFLNVDVLDVMKNPTGQFYELSLN